MRKYRINAYQEGFEPDQARIGFEVARSWIWPYAYDLADLRHLPAQPDSDPPTRHYCHLGDEMVGYMASVALPPEGTAGPRPISIFRVWCWDMNRLPIWSMTIDNTNRSTGTWSSGKSRSGRAVKRPWAENLRRARRQQET